MKTCLWVWFLWSVSSLGGKGEAKYLALYYSFLTEMLGLANLSKWLWRQSISLYVTEIYCVAQAGLELMQILQPQPRVLWCFRIKPPCQAHSPFHGDAFYWGSRTHPRCRSGGGLHSANDLACTLHPRIHSPGDCVTAAITVTSGLPSPLGWFCFFKGEIIFLTWESFNWKEGV